MRRQDWRRSAAAPAPHHPFSPPGWRRWSRTPANPTLRPRGGREVRGGALVPPQIERWCAGCRWRNGSSVQRAQSRAAQRGRGDGEGSSFGHWPRPATACSPACARALPWPMPIRPRPARVAAGGDGRRGCIGAWTGARPCRARACPVEHHRLPGGVAVRAPHPRRHRPLGRPANPGPRPCGEARVAMRPRPCGERAPWQSLRLVAGSGDQRRQTLPILFAPGSRPGPDPRLRSQEGGIGPWPHALPRRCPPLSWPACTA